MVRRVEWSEPFQTIMVSLERNSSSLQRHKKITKFWNWNIWIYSFPFIVKSWKNIPHLLFKVDLIGYWMTWKPSLNLLIRFYIVVYNSCINCFIFFLFPNIRKIHQTLPLILSLNLYKVRLIFNIWCYWIITYSGFFFIHVDLCIRQEFYWAAGKYCIRNVGR